MTDYPTTETVARILARGYNQHTQDHGPDSSAAGEVTQTADGHSLTVVRDGAEYAVRVTRAQAGDESHRWQIEEARKLLAAWDEQRNPRGDIYSTERALADQVRTLLAIIGPANESS